MTYTIAVSNEKGGVAKTTTTMSLGAGLAEAGNKILLIDLDPQSNLTLAAGLEINEVSISSSNILIEAASLMSAKQSTDIEEIDIIPAHPNIESAEQYLPIRTNYTRILREAIENAAPLPYDYLIFDCPPFLGAITQNALGAADLLIIPTQAEFFSAYALRNMMGLIKRLRDDTNPDLAYRILITMLDRRNRTHRNIEEQLKSTFGKGLFNTVIEIDTKLRESPIAGMPITQYKSSTRGSQQYRSLAQELIKYVKEEIKQQA
ncbi:MAG: ParA family protein [Thaumarchaeota archaeon]|nr:ParA family protein [Nitrososphaerota archaeon]